MLFTLHLYGFISKKVAKFGESIACNIISYPIHERCTFRLVRLLKNFLLSWMAL